MSYFYLCGTWWRNQMELFPRYWPFVKGIHRWPVDSLRKGQWRGALMFSLICAWTNDWENHRDASHLIRHLAHYDVSVMSLVVMCNIQVVWHNSWDNRVTVKSAWQSLTTSFVFCNYTRNTCICARGATRTTDLIMLHSIHISHDEHHISTNEFTISPAHTRQCNLSTGWQIIFVKYISNCKY